MISNLETARDVRGALTAVEGLPFAIKRAYWLHGVPAGADRGGHAQRTTRRLMVAVSGSFKVTLRHRRGSDRYGDFLLDSPTVGLHIPPLTWVELSDFSPGAVCLVLASTEYDETDSIRDFGDFVRAP